MQNFKLTHYSHGAGCGCKIAPKKLEQILCSSQPQNTFPLLLVGNESKDDAAVYDLEDGTGIVSTTDFFTPIVDNPFLYGDIASVNAMSDVYAMGGQPLMALAILGWPVDKIPMKIAKDVLEGSRAACARAHIPLAGGHSIDTPEPIFGLSVTGRVTKKYLKQNNSAKEGSLLYLTKPLGIGIVTTAQKKGIVQETHMKKAIASMCALNYCGVELAKLPYVHAMTDVTGFGLLGHLKEMCEGSHLSASIEFSKIPIFDFLDTYIQQESIPGGTHRNWDSYGYKIALTDIVQKLILADPQTSGGLLLSVDEEYAVSFEQIALDCGLDLKPFGRFTKKKPILIRVT